MIPAPPDLNFVESLTAASGISWTPDEDRDRLYRAESRGLRFTALDGECGRVELRAKDQEGGSVQAVGATPGAAWAALLRLAGRVCVAG